ncbi:MAG: hypothetical protein IT365_16540 [Candidatus Hydrogenedentes bacterium]|nr:hypothetical protein [Candidatus Hydrogenedentota bacterium]
MRFWLWGLGMLASVSAHGAGYGTLEHMWGPPECVAVVGNGGLTLGLDADGCITVCRWPGPGSPNQVPPPPRDANASDARAVAPRGLSWGFRYAGKTYWLEPQTTQLAQRHGTTLTSSHSLPGLDISLTQELTVHPNKGLACIRLSISGLQQDLDAFWYADFSPDDRVIPELPDASGLPASLRDFAAYLDTAHRTAFHFRPSALSSIDWREAETWTRQDAAPPPGAVARDGVWIGYTVVEQRAFVWCGPADGPQSVRAQLETGEGAHAASAMGQTASAAAFPIHATERERTATIFLAFGKTHEEVLAGLQYATERGYEGILQESREYVQRLLGALPPWVHADPKLQEALLNAQSTLAASLDYENHAIVRAPLARPPLAVDIPRHSIWAGLALDALRQTETAERHLEFLLSAVRREDRPGMPAGSLPAALHTNESQGAPHVILDGEAPAWLLWAIWQHAANMDAESGKAFLSRHWDTAQAMAAFLMNRSGQRPNTPVYSFAPESLGEDESASFLIAAYVGLKSALAIAGILGEERPEWQTCQRDLEDRVRTWFDESIDSEVNQVQALALWPTGIIDAEDPRWDAVAAVALQSLESTAPEVALRTAFQLAMLWRDHPERLERLVVVLPEIFRRANEARPVDSLDAARTVLTCAAVSGNLQLR